VTSVETPFVIADAMPPIPLFVAGATSVFLFVTCGDISPRRGENLSFPGEAILRKNDFREDGLQTLSKRHILCYDKREELLPGGNRIYTNLL
jgi:hypothetical protein